MAEFEDWARRREVLVLLGECVDLAGGSWRLCR
jgi:hypothetical protein